MTKYMLVVLSLICASISSANDQIRYKPCTRDFTSGHLGSNCGEESQSIQGALANLKSMLKEESGLYAEPVPPQDFDGTMEEYIATRDGIQEFASDHIFTYAPESKKAPFELWVTGVTKVDDDRYIYKVGGKLAKTYRGHGGLGEMTRPIPNQSLYLTPDGACKSEHWYTNYWDQEAVGSVRAVKAPVFPTLNTEGNFYGNDCEYFDKDNIEEVYSQLLGAHDFACVLSPALVSTHYFGETCLGANGVGNTLARPQCVHWAGDPHSGDESTCLFKESLETYEIHGHHPNRTTVWYTINNLLYIEANSGIDPMPCEGNPDNGSDPFTSATGVHCMPAKEKALQQRSLIPFERRYGSVLSSSLEFGRKWNFTYGAKLVQYYGSYYRSSARPLLLNLYTETGKAITFPYLREVGETETVRLADDNYILTVVDLNDTIGYQVRYPNGQLDTFKEGRLIARITHDGKPLSMEYSYDGELQKVLDGYGNGLVFIRDSNRTAGKHLVVRVEDLSGWGVSYEYNRYDQYAKLVSAIDDNGNGEIYTYEKGFLVAVDDAATSKRIVTWEHDEYGNTIGNTREDGTASVRVVSRTESYSILEDNQGKQWKESFSVVAGASRVTSVECLNCADNGGVEQYIYNDDGQLIEKKTRAGRRTQYEWSEEGYLTKTTKGVTDGLVQTVAELTDGVSDEATELANALIPETIVELQEWDTTLGKVTKRTSGTREANFSYDPQGRLLSHIEKDLSSGEERVTAYTYNQHGKIITIDGPLATTADAITVTYDNKGRLAEVLAANGYSYLASEYNEWNRPQKVVDGGVEIRFSYDDKGLLIQINRQGEKRNFTYNENHLVETMSYPGGGKTTYTYDVAERLIASTEANGFKTELEYDTSGNVASIIVKKPDGSVFRQQNYSYDLQNRLASNSAGSLLPTDYAYDADGILVGVSQGQDGLLRTLDHLGRVTTVTLADESTISLEYDQNEELNRVLRSMLITTPTLETTFSKNAWGQVEEAVMPETGASMQTFDQAGRELQEINSASEISMEYDNLGRLTALNAVKDDNSQAARLEYLSTTAAYEPTKVVSDGIEVDRIYSSAGKLAVETLNSDFGTTSLSIGYTDEQLVNLIEYPSGNSLRYYYADGSVSKITLVRHGQTAEIIVADQIKFASTGQLTSYRLGNGMQIDRIYNADGSVDQITSNGNPLIDYTYNAKGLITEIEDINGAQRFDYDSVNRITSAEGHYGVFEYEYDYLGNRTNKKVDGVDGPSTYDPMTARILSGSDSEAEPVVLDDLGRTTRRGIWNLEYDLFGNLVTASVPGVHAEGYYYEPDGVRRVSATTTPLNVKAEHFHYHPDIEWQLLSVTDENGSLVEEYYHLEGMPIAMSTYRINAGMIENALPDMPVPIGDIPKNLDAILAEPVTPDEELFFFVSDSIDTVNTVYDAVGEIVWVAEASPFGVRHSTADDAIPMRLRFPGQIAVDTTGLHYNFYRDYDPVSGRYIQSDPVGLNGGANTYAYAYQNPKSYVDPEGLTPIHAGRAGWFIGGRLINPALNSIATAIVGSDTTLGSEVYDIIHDDSKDSVDEDDCGCWRILERRNSWHEGDEILWEYHDCIRECKEEQQCE